MSPLPVLRPTPVDRLPLIEQARRAVLGHEGALAPLAIAPWIERSWRRCLSSGQAPQQAVGFEAVSAQAARRAQEASRPLVLAARPVLDQLMRAMAGTRYFAILTDAQGIVVDVNGPIDRGDRRADLIARVGVDLSERAVGTTAIGAALTELQPVWLHRGEHFFAANSVYSCAGAPLFGPHGDCVGMLDLTGVEAPERPEFKHLVTRSARSIENQLLLGRPHALLLRLSWPGGTAGGDSDGLLTLDAEGRVLGSNLAARQMLSLSPRTAEGAPPLHCADLFALPWQMLFDGARQAAAALEAPLWSGLRLQVLPLTREAALAHDRHRAVAAPVAPMQLKDLETALIRKAVDQTRGNVAEAARALGISRATVYRKIGRPGRR
ncbi:helix-turn-helix domain-containing protein [Ramlibacter sp. 2FC]|uniref:helix-turn-helix domain-containing protein n=1 Tax=Ramlibacter sp. 2FC TaxID=2502188 RepID=UPI0010F59021|nr:helix-turn-helix domain-containing protein [Ramlibacter sp. 2FC]